MSCHNCKQKYDLMCANLSPKRFKKMSQDGKSTWKCLECKSKLPKVDNTNTPVRAAHQSTDEGETGEHCLSRDYVTTRRNRSADAYVTKDTLREILSTELKNEIEAVLEATLTRLVSNQLKDIRSQFSDLQESMAYISGQYEDLKKLLGTNSSEVQSLKEENKVLKENLNTLTSRVKTLEDDSLKQQQWVRLQNIEVTGIPEDKEENTVAIIQKLSEHIGVTIGPSDVEFAHRVQPRRAASGAGARPIVARLRHRIVKDKIVAAARKYRELNTREVGIGRESSKIYVNEHLTKENKMLLSLCKQKGKELNYKFIWTKNCRIFMRKNETSPPVPINSSTDLIKIV